jgi:hypothetical protein
MAGTNGGQRHALVDEQIVYATLGAIDQALEQALVARTARERRWQLNQLRGLLVTLPTQAPSLEEGLRRMVRVLGTPLVDR